MAVLRERSRTHRDLRMGETTRESRSSASRSRFTIPVSLSPVHQFSLRGGAPR